MAIGATDVRGPNADAGTDLVAFLLDRAVWTFGTSVEKDMDEAEAQISRGKTRPKPERVAQVRQRVLDSYLDLGKAREETTKGRFRDPALSRNRRR
jgi:hypothetical protein